MRMRQRATPAPSVSPGSRIIETIWTQQHLNPHQTLREALENAAIRPDLVLRAVRVLGLDTSRKIGRLRRAELALLGRTIRRYWQEWRRGRPDL